MVDVKTIRFVALTGIVIGLYFLSLIQGDWIFGKDVRLCQVIIFCSMFIGVLGALAGSYIDKKYPIR